MENFIEPEKKETNGEKEQKSYKVFDEHKIIVDKSTEKIKAYSNDILLIRNILEKNYDNYFHFKNVINCLLYLQKKYCKNNLIESENNEFIRIDKNLNYLEYKYNSFYKNINEINILIKIEKKDINKEIYFLDNGYKKKENGNYIKHYAHDNLKELNKYNTKLYINKKKYEYKKYFKPEKEGKYEINIKFNIDLVDCSYMFAGCKNIINMKYMFYE